MAEPAAFDIRAEAPGPVLAVRGDWTVDTIGEIERDLRAGLSAFVGPARIDVAGLGRLDVAGAYLLDRSLGAIHGGRPLDLLGAHPTAATLLAAAREATSECPPAPPQSVGIVALLERIGRQLVLLAEDMLSTLSFFGETLATIGRLIVQPSKIRWTSVFHVMEHAGLNALPIVALLSFFIGLVVAYLGARILGDFGASVFTVELVAFSVMREFGVVITAVLLAGRTDSAFTAEIGAMKMRQEIDAMRVMGIEPMEALVAPRVIAMFVMTPILTFAAVMAGLFGGLLVCWGELGISPNMFLNRISDAVPEQHFWVGMSKSLVFGPVLAMIGCRQGLSVGGDVASLGQRVTASVVQSIFFVILLDAVFALWFLELDL